MKKKIVPILLALVILFVLFILIDPGFRQKVSVIVDYISSWLGIDWSNVSGWRSAKLLP